MRKKTKSRYCRIIYVLAAVLISPGIIFGVSAADTSRDSLFQLFSRAAPQSVVSQSFAGAGTAMPYDGFQGLVNPSLTTALGGAGGVFSAGYGRGAVFDKLTLPFGAVFAEENGAMGLYYRYLRGSRGDVHDAVVNFAGRLFEQVDAQGAVEFGLNIRYEQSSWRRDVWSAGAVDGDDTDDGVMRTVSANSQNFLFDIGFYQPHVYPGLDFSLVVANLFGYGWHDIDGEEETKTDDWTNRKHRAVIAGVLYTLPVWSSLALRIPLDLEMANLFTKSLPNKYVVRAGAEARIAGKYCVRFGYARAPESPLDLVTDFDYKNLFFGGVGVSIKPVLIDFFAGKDEFGITATYAY